MDNRCVYCGEIIHMYFCRVDHFERQNLDEDEFLDVERIPLEKAVQMASYYPAKVLGIDKNVGLLEPGYVANLVAYDDNWQVQRVMMGGIWTYERNN